MFHLSGDDMTLFGLGLGGGEPCGVIGFRTAAGEDHFFGIGTDELGDLLTSGRDVTADLAAEGMHAGRVAVQRPESGHHGFNHFGSDGGRGVIVEIDDVSHVTPPPR